MTKKKIFLWMMVLTLAMTTFSGCSFWKKLTGQDDDENNTTDNDIPASSIYITSTPSGAKIYLDDTDTGKVTPATLDSVSVENHTIKLTLTGYLDWVQAVSILAEQKTDITATLQLNHILFSDDFESGNLDNWTIGGRQQYGTNIANVVSRGGNLVGHLFHDSFTEITMHREFQYDSSNSGTFYFDLEVDVFSESPPASNYYGLSGLLFNFLDSGDTELGSVRYVAATTNYPFINWPSLTTSVHKISENVMHHYEIPVSDMLSQITIDQTQIAEIQMLLYTYSSTAPYPYVSSEIWIDNVSFVD